MSIFSDLYSDTLDMLLLLIGLLVLVLAILFVPGTEPMTKLIFLSILLVSITVYSIYVLIRTKPTPSDSHPSPAGQADGCAEPSYCQECNANPCRCTEVIPNQTECPKCRGLLGASPVAGVQSCHDCGRCYRCPGCLLQ